MRALLGQLAGLASRQPVLCVFEDVHWIDPSTLELLDRMVEVAENAPLLLLVTFRPEFSAPWAGRAHTVSMLLSRLGRRDSLAMVEALSSSQPLAEALVEAIVSKTDGVPLFVEEMTRTVLASRPELETPRDGRDGGQHSRLKIPMTPAGLPNVPPRPSRSG